MTSELGQAEAEGDQALAGGAHRRERGDGGSLLLGVGAVPVLARRHRAGLGEEHRREQAEEVGDAGEVAKVLLALDEADERAGHAPQLLGHGVLEGVAEVLELGGRQQADRVAHGWRGPLGRPRPAHTARSKVRPSSVTVLMTNGAIGVRGEHGGRDGGEPGVAVGEERVVVLGVGDHLEVEVAPRVGGAGADRAAGAHLLDPGVGSEHREALSWRRTEPTPGSRRCSVGGSIGAGTADAWSDLDLEVVTHAEQHDAFLADRDTWLAAITPTVFARTPIAPFVINTVTDEGLTFDLAVWAGEVPEWPTPPVRYAVGMLSATPFEDLGDALEYAVAEQLRGMAGPFISLIEREEHLRHLTGVPHLLGLLTTVFLAETGAVPPGKHWNGTYTEEQRAARRGAPAGERHPRGADRLRPRARPSSSSPGPARSSRATTSSGRASSPRSPPRASRSSSGSTCSAWLY